MTSVLETDRLLLRQFELEDASFILRLVNEPAFLQYIGDKGVRTEADAIDYLRSGPIDSYGRHGFGLWAVILRDSGELLGMCGLLKREGLDDVDIGFAFVEEHRRRGYGLESAAAVLDYARDQLGLTRVVAITAPDNEASAALLLKLSLHPEGMIRLPGSDDVSRLFAVDLRDRG